MGVFRKYSGVCMRKELKELYDMPFGIHPKEYKKAINRGTTFYPEDADILQHEMRKHGKLDCLRDCLSK